MNNRTGNKVFIDSTGQAVTQSPCKVTYVFFTPGANGDKLELSEAQGSPVCFTVSGAVAKQTTLYRVPENALVFTAGIFVQTLPSGATAVLVTSNSSSGGN